MTETQKLQGTATLFRLAGFAGLVECVVLLFDASREGAPVVRIPLPVLDAGHAVQPEHLVRSVAFSSASLIAGLALLGGAGFLARWLWRGVGQPVPGEMERRTGEGLVAIFSGFALSGIGLAWLGVAEIAAATYLASQDPDPAQYLLSHLAGPLVAVLIVGSGSLRFLPRVRELVRQRMGLPDRVETGVPPDVRAEARQLGMEPARDLDDRPIEP